MKVYKYRSVEKEIFEKDFRALSENCFFSSNHSMLNDPFDIYFNEEISKSINILKTLSPFQKVDNFKNQLKEVLQYKEEIGVYCLSKDFLNEQLWAYYASSYSGYCIEYDLEKLVDKGQNFDFQYQFEIDYKDNIPTLNINDIINLQDGFIKKMFATKKTTWKHEKEIRLIFNKYGMKKFHPSAITGVYFGIKTEEKIKTAFYDLFKDMDVEFYEVFPSDFKLDFKLINETKRKLKYNINNFEFDILQHITDAFHESYYIFYRSSVEEAKIKEFILAFRETFCIKESTLFVFNKKEVKSLISASLTSEEEYIHYADSIITVINDWEEAGIYNPYKDSYYDEIKNKNK